MPRTFLIFTSSFYKHLLERVWDFFWLLYVVYDAYPFSICYIFHHEHQGRKNSICPSIVLVYVMMELVICISCIWPFAQITLYYIGSGAWLSIALPVVSSYSHIMKWLPNSAEAILITCSSALYFFLSLNIHIYALVVFIKYFRILVLLDKNVQICHLILNTESCATDAACMPDSNILFSLKS